MVGIIENQSVIEGSVAKITQVPDEQGYYHLQVKLEHSAAVGSLPNLAQADEGTLILIKVSPQQWVSLSAARKGLVSCKVRKAFGQVYFMMGNR